MHAPAATAAAAAAAACRRCLSSLPASLGAFVATAPDSRTQSLADGGCRPHPPAPHSAPRNDEFLLRSLASRRAKTRAYCDSPCDDDSACDSSLGSIDTSSSVGRASLSPVRNLVQQHSGFRVG
jgi:hypothetical protein